MVEGIDGSGKSTQIRLLEKWLISKGMRVFLTVWNSSELVKEITTKGKKKGRLTPTTFSLLHATDFADRHERNIFPLVHAGYIVLADRYVYRWVRQVYEFAIKPNITFYFGVPVDVASERILAGRPKLKYYEAGMDLNLSNDAYESYRIFQSRIIEQYESMAQSEGFVTIDGTSGIEEQQYLVRKKIMETIPECKSVRPLVKAQVL